MNSKMENALSSSMSPIEKAKSLILNTEKESLDQAPWYAVRLFGCKQQQVVDYFTEHQIESFVPMQWVVQQDANGKRRKRLRPVVTNLLFLKKTVTTREMTDLVKACVYSIAIMRKSRGDASFCEIPPQQMLEFRVMCNPDFEAGYFLSEEDAHLKLGDAVSVKYGPLKGLTGRLVRQSRKYYLLKEVPGMAVMVKVSRWCCVPEKKA